jgi:hypothetical protein
MESYNVGQLAAGNNNNMDVFRPSVLEDYGANNDEVPDTLGEAGTFLYRPYHSIQYTELILQEGKSNAGAKSKILSKSFSFQRMGGGMSEEFRARKFPGFLVA